MLFKLTPFYFQTLMSSVDNKASDTFISSRQVFAGLSETAHLL